MKCYIACLLIVATLTDQAKMQHIKKPSHEKVNKIDNLQATESIFVTLYQPNELIKKIN